MIALSPPNVQGNAWKYVKDCLDTGWVSYAGKYVNMLEEKICEYTGSKYAVATVSGTAALEISLRVAGVKPGDEVIIPTLTFVATAAVVRHIGAEPIFMDCDEYLQMDVGKLEQFLANECSMTDQGLVSPSGKIIKAIMPVHIFGDICEMRAIVNIAKLYGLKVIEDACEALGSWLNNRHAGTIGDIGCFSFSPNKIITAGGGGIIVTGNKQYADYARYLTTTAKDDVVNYIHNEVGYNYRMSNIHAALGLSQMELLDEFIRIKKNNYALYKKGFESIKGVTLLGYSEDVIPNYWLYAIQLEGDRKQLLKHLDKHNIQTRPLWYLNHWQKPYKQYQAHKITRAPQFWESVLNIPSGSELNEEDIQTVIEAIRSFKC